MTLKDLIMEDTDILIQKRFWNFDEVRQPCLSFTRSPEEDDELLVRFIVNDLAEDPEHPEVVIFESTLEQFDEFLEGMNEFRKLLDKEV